MSQVIIVSNRLPISVTKKDGKLVFSASLGGLATGLSSYVDRDSNNLWIGWPGIADEELTNSDRQEIASTLLDQGYIPVFLSEKQIDNFYNGYSNSILWPLFHGLPYSVSDEKNAEWWRAYKTVNQKYTEAVLTVTDPKSQIWVHDYQLLLVPDMLRQEGSIAHIGFFLHIPFPEAKQLHKLKQSSNLIKGILAADLVGFHTTGYVNNFKDASKDYYLAEVASGRLLNVNSRFVKVDEFPMGIDYDKFAAAGKTKTVKDQVKIYKSQYKGQKIIASVDRLDPSKGLMERLKAYRGFLEKHPERQGKVVFIMVAAPSRTNIKVYQNLSLKLDKLATDINKEFSTKTWKALEYINQPMPFESVTALFQIADLAFITPIRDGMNLTAKEFVASNKVGGVLVLSSTAGAAEELKEDALIVDPQDSDSLIEALETGLIMDRRELRRRLKRMRQQLSTNNVHAWAKTFVDTLQQPVPGTPRLTRGLSSRLQSKLIASYKTANKRLFLLDYDGTLLPLTNNFLEAEPNKKLFELIKKLASQPDNEVVLISGRKSEDLENWFSELPINLVAEHGAAVKTVGHKWRTIESENTAWKKTILPYLERYAKNTPGAKIEVKPHSLAWHYRGSPPYYAQKNSVTLKRVLKPLLKKYNLELMQGNKVLEIKNPAASKGTAAKRWLKKPHDFVLAIGDDVTDEDLFEALGTLDNSIKVGRGLTKAKFRVVNYKDVIKLLNKLT